MSAGGEIVVVAVSGVSFVAPVRSLVAAKFLSLSPSRSREPIAERVRRGHLLRRPVVSKRYD